MALEDYIIRDLRSNANGTTSTVAEELHFTVDVLRGRLDGSRTAISPLSFFTLSKVGFVSGLGTILTYIIVLMQFKASEPVAPTTAPP